MGLREGGAQGVVILGGACNWARAPPASILPGSQVTSRWCASAQRAEAVSPTKGCTVSAESLGQPSLASRPSVLGTVPTSSLRSYSEHSVCWFHAALIVLTCAALLLVFRTH